MRHAYSIFELIMVVIFIIFICAGMFLPAIIYVRKHKNEQSFQSTENVIITPNQKWKIVTQGDKISIAPYIPSKVEAE